jgi:pimeloyl-ACP methyl ester carboxylesterase
MATAATMAGTLLTGTPAVAAEKGKIDWQLCPGFTDVDCGTVTVPLDWAHPGRGTVKLALARRKATDPAARIGSVLMDPGGPGGGGAIEVKGGWTLSPEITRRFDTVGFDPRGIGESTQVLCGLDEVTAPFPDVPKNQAEFDQLAEHNRAVAESCDKHTGPLARLADTKSVARDMDAIRAALGEAKLTYYGVSYGTLMGQQYAELFPDRVRALVLDSNMDHSVPNAWEFLSSETESAQAEFEQFAAWCDRTASCVLHGENVSAIARKLQDRAATGDLTDPRSGDPITPLSLATKIRANFYGPSFANLAIVLRSLRDGVPPQEGGATAKASDIGINTVFQSVFCSDWRLPVHNFAELEAYRRAAAAVNPDVKVNPLGWTAVTGCIGWPNRTTNPQHPLSIHGSAPLLMLNSRYDPATPYAWAQTAARQSGTTLLTYDGWGHGAYFKNSDCVVKATDAYLISGKLPARGTHCAAVEPTDQQARIDGPRAPSTTTF